MSARGGNLLCKVCHQLVLLRLLVLPAVQCICCLGVCVLPRRSVILERCLSLYLTSFASLMLYTLCIHPPPTSHLPPPTFRRSVILERCLKRLEWDRARAREAQALEDELERERVAMQQVCVG